MSAIVKQTQRMAEQIQTPEQIQVALAKVFQDSQASVTAHRKQVILLKVIQQRAFQLDAEESFNYFFCKLVNKVLVIKRTETVGDRIAKLVASFIMSLEEDNAKEQEEEEENSDEDDDDTIFSRFVHYFIHHLLRGIESKDKNVRYRVVQFLSFAMGGLGEIDDELYSSLMFQLDKRLQDKEPSIRIKALHCIARFQEPEGDDDGENDEVDEATGKLLYAIQNDISPEVRRAALLNLAKTKSTKHYLLERARDTNSINRRLVYSRIIKEMGDFRTIDSKTRERLLSWGLKDREESVQKACVKMFAKDWLDTLDGDLIELLERLHITKSEVAEMAMRNFFDYRKEVTSKINFPHDLWYKLTPEISFLARCFYYHCYTNTLNDVIDNNYPESAELAKLLSTYLEARTDLPNVEDVEDLDFIIEQLLTIGVNYDFSDEIGRRAMLQVIRSSLTNDRLTEKLIKLALQVLKKLSINERDFTTMVSEMITDLNEEEEESSEEVVIHCLSICKAMLSLTNESLKDNILIDSLIETLINPAVKTDQPRIRELGFEALGLCCLLDLQLASDQLYLFGLCLSRGHEELRMIAIKAMFDILSVHGTKVLDVEDGVDSLSLHKLFYRTLKNDELPELQALCAEGLCKLFLADVLTDDELLETLILTYYTPSNSRNQSLLQAFSFCLPVYCFSHPRHQEKMSKVAADAFSRLYSAHAEAEEDEEEMVSPQIMLQQLIHWTDPMNVVNQDPVELNKSNSHLIFSIDLIQSLEKIDSKKYKKMVLLCLPKLTIGDNLKKDDLIKLEEALDESHEYFDEMDTVSRNAYNKIKTKVMSLLEAAVEREKVDEKDQEFSVILEGNEQEEEEGNEEDEIDEDFEKEQSRIHDTNEDDHDDKNEVADGDVSIDQEVADEGVVHNSVEGQDISSSSVDDDGDLSME